MNKKIKFLSIIILAIVMLVTSLATSVMAEPKILIPFSGTVDIELIDPGKVWTAGNTLHVKDSYWYGVSIGPAGPAPYERWYEQITINLVTGEGTFKATVKITFPMPDTIVEAHTVTGTITDFIYYEGKFVNHGTGFFEGVMMKGTMTHEITVGNGYDAPSTGHSEFMGMQKFPKDFVFP